MEIKNIEVFDAIKDGFSWVYDVELRKLFGAFFIAMISGSIFSLLLLAGLFPIFIDVEKLGDIPYLSVILPTLLPFLSLVFAVLIIALLIFIFLVFYGLGWNKDRNFVKLLFLFLEIQLFISVASTLLIAIIFYFVISAALGIGIEIPFIDIFRFQPASIPIYAAAILIGIAFVLSIVVNFVWAYLGSFFLLSKILERRKEKNKFLEINLKNFTEYVKFLILDMATISFNWIQPKILAVQVVIYLILTFLTFTTISGLYQLFVTIPEGPFTSIPSEFGSMFLSVLLSVIVLFIAFILCLYNTIRLYLSVPMRVIETDSAKEALRLSWERTRGYGIGIFIVMIIAAIVLMILYGISGIVDAVTEQISKLFLPFVVVQQFFSIVLSTAVGVAGSFIIACVMLSLYKQVKKRK